MEELISLYPSQNPVFQFLVRRGGHCGIELPTGMGKTVILVAVIGELLKRKMKILVTAPQTHIEDGFTHRPYTQIQTDTGVVDVPDESIRAARESPQIVPTIRAYLESPTAPPYALACTHAALCYFRPPTGVPQDLSNCVLIIDEAHHVPALGFSQFVDAFIANGGRVIYSSATMFRTDEEPVIRPDMEMYKVSLAEFMATGGAPRRFRSEVNVIRLGERVEREVMTGDREPSDPFQRRIVQQMVTRWQEDDRPKAIVRVPPLRGGSSPLVARVVRAFRRAGARVLDVTGSNPETKRQFHESLIAERALSHYDDSQYDVIVGIQRVREGMDWKWCSTVYCVGLPNSLQMITQLMGRASRKKQPRCGYPRSHREIFQIEFFVPCGDERTFQGLPRFHSQNVLLICAFLDDYERQREWGIIQELNRGISVPLSEALPQDGPGQTPKRLREAYVDPQHASEVRTLVTHARENLIAIGRDPSIGNVYHWVVEHQPEVPRSVLKHVLADMITLDEGCSLTQAKRRLFEELNAHLAEGLPLHVAIIQAFNTVLDGMESRNIISGQSVDSDRLRRRVLQLTGQDMTRLAAELARRRPLTTEWMIDVCRDHRTRSGDLPTRDTPGGPEGWDQETWTSLDTSIRLNDRAWQLPQINSLEEFGRLYVRHRHAGTIAEVLQVAARDTGLLGTAAFRHMLNAFLSSKVRLNGDESLTPLRDLPAFPPRADRRHYPVVGTLLSTWLGIVQDVVDEPVTLTHAWALCRRLSQWFTDHRTANSTIAGTDRTACRDFTCLWGGTELVFNVRAANERLTDLRPWLYPARSLNDYPYPLQSGQFVYASLIRCPFSSSRNSGEISVSQVQQDEMLGSRLIEARCLPVTISLLGNPGRNQRFRASTVDEFPEWHNRGQSATATLDLQVPIGWFTHWIAEAGNGRRHYTCEPIDIRSVLRRVPQVLEYNGASNG
jgi:hypothetical protein